MSISILADARASHWTQGVAVTLAGRIILKIIIPILMLCCCVDASLAPDPSSGVLLACGEAPSPQAVPTVTYFIEGGVLVDGAVTGGVWMAKMSQSDLDLIAVDLDLLVAWERCATSAIGSQR